ncbi:alginate lyase family protein [Marinimicrobium sp. ARAG 43.8]|uniref:alginate lyase family protein n=1 Tax=Marinimicrobium sp. ARAG 43.8 TaxID=3418719 RepID=UPI003CEB2963
MSQPHRFPARSTKAWRLLITIAVSAWLSGCQGLSDYQGLSGYQSLASTTSLEAEVVRIEQPRIERKANAYLNAEPRTVTADHSERSAGGAHDFYSEGDYWWPDPDNPNGPYIRRDGLSNPDNFIAHRQSLMRFSDIVASLTSAYLLTEDRRYAQAAIRHLNAWFVDADTRMTPHLRYAQAIHGRNTGRSIGVIDTIHLVEVARSAQHLMARDQLTGDTREQVLTWFSDYLHWLTTHPFGLKEREHPNNHGVTWAMQAAAFADLTGNTALLAEIRHDFKTRFVGEMMNTDGGFPAELARTKPYGYSLFVLDAMATLAQIASTPDDNLWQYRDDKGRGLPRAMAFMRPYIADKTQWPLPPDAMYWDNWPVRQISLVLSAWAYEKPGDIDLWQSLDADPDEYEVRRNLPVRHPLLWLSERAAGVPALQPHHNHNHP